MYIQKLKYTFLVLFYIDLEKSFESILMMIGVC